MLLGIVNLFSHLDLFKSEALCGVSIENGKFDEQPVVCDVEQGSWWSLNREWKGLVPQPSRADHGGERSPNRELKGRTDHFLVIEKRRTRVESCTCSLNASREGNLSKTALNDRELARQ